MYARVTAVAVSAAALLACGVSAAVATPTGLPTRLPVTSTPTVPVPSPKPTSPTKSPTASPPESPTKSPTASPTAPSKTAAGTDSPRPSTGKAPSGSTSPAQPGKAEPGRGTATKPSLIDLKAGARAQAAKNRADHRVATLAQQIAAEAKRVQQRSEASATAEQRYVAQLGVESRARAAAVTAAERVASARAALRHDQQMLAAAAAAAYETYTGPDSLGISTIGSLLIADDPSAVLDTGSEQGMLVAHQAAVVGQLKLALQTLRHAEAAQSAAEVTVTRETARLAGLRSEADAALADAKRTITTLTAALGNAKVSQKVADAALSSFLGGWSTADPRRAGALNLAYTKLALKNKHRKPAPAGPHWTPAMGRTVVERALPYIGTNYAWAGGQRRRSDAGRLRTR